MSTTPLFGTPRVHSWNAVWRPFGLTHLLCRSPKVNAFFISIIAAMTLLCWFECWAQCIASLLPVIGSLRRISHSTLCGFHAQMNLSAWASRMSLLIKSTSAQRNGIQVQSSSFLIPLFYHARPNMHPSDRVSIGPAWNSH